MSDKTLQMIIKLLQTVFEGAWKRWEERQREKLIKKAIEEGDAQIEAAFKKLDGSEIDAAFGPRDSRMLKSDDQD